MAGCTGCGTQLPDGARFCLECGRPVAAQCAGCDAPLPSQAKFCMECGTPTAAGSGAPRAPQTSEPTGASSRRTTSILFADLVGFTTLSETRDTEDVRELLGRYFDECRQIVARYGGTIEKFIGDAVMAVWGVPTAQEDDAERAVRAGLELVSAVTEFGRDVGAPDLALRVGVVTGEVAVTTGATHQGMVAGDPVNTAARVQSAAAPGQVWVDETTRLLTAAAITYTDAGSHPLKGKVEPVPLWSVRAVVAAVGGAQRADGLEAPLVGRDRELRLVKELFHQVQESGRPSLLVVDGEPGVGKTRLAWEFEKYVDGLNDSVRWHSGRCVAYGEGVAYFALAEAVRGRLRAVSDSDDTATQLDATLARFLPDADERDWLRGRLATLLGANGHGTSYPRDDLFSAWTVFFERVAGDQPLLLVIDNAQHADDGLLAFLEHLVTVATFPCYVVLLTRPGLTERAAGLAAHRRTNLLRLDTLTDTDVARLLDGLVAGLPGDVRDQLVARSDGIPVFAVETIRSLIDRDLVVPRGGQYVLADDAPLDLDTLAAPASLQALIAARLDALPADQRHVVDRASVLGTTFTAEALTALCSDIGDIDDLPQVLGQLQRAQILAHDLNRLSATHGQLSFVQTALRQVAYGVLSRRDRKAFHLAVVAHFEGAGDTGDATAPIRAQHYLEALAAVPDAVDAPALRTAAVDNLVRAATRATGLGSHAEAVRHLAAATPLLEDGPRRAEVLVEQARAEFEAGDWDASIDHAREAEELSLALGDRRAAALAAGVRGQTLSIGQRRLEEATAVARPWWEEVRGDPQAVQARLQLSQTLATTLMRSGEADQALEIMHERLQLAEEQQDTAAIASTLNQISIWYSDRGMMTVAGAVLVSAADIAKAADDRTFEALTRVNLTAITNPDDLAAALRHAQEGDEVAVRAGSRYMNEFLVTNRLIAMWHAGLWSEMDTVLSRHEARFGATTDEYALILRAMRARARGEEVAPPGPMSSDQGDEPTLLAQGDLIRALEGSPPADAVLGPALAVARTVHELTGAWDDLHMFHGFAAGLALELGDEDAVRELVEQASDERRMPRALLGHRGLLQAWLAGRSPAGAEPAEDPGALFASAVELYEGFGSPVYVAHAHRWWGAWLLEQDRVDEAAGHLATARTTYERLGATVWLADLDAATQTTSLRP